MKIFIDTSAFYALLDANDDFHYKAKENFFNLLQEGNNFHCSNYILIETIALLQNRLGLECVRAFKETMLPLMKIHWIDQRIHEIALSNLIVANKDISLVDYTSFILVRELGLDKVFAFDRHFIQQGFEVLPANF
ncbi:MAG: PIN domain-containing protein [Actinobacteria bacterium]|nr:PIN domain-containing protein [Actinomycetota bacterium]